MFWVFSWKYSVIDAIPIPCRYKIVRPLQQSSAVSRGVVEPSG
jgi:hypothetical protein